MLLKSCPHRLPMGIQLFPEHLEPRLQVGFDPPQDYSAAVLAKRAGEVAAYFVQFILELFRRHLPAFLNQFECRSQPTFKVLATPESLDFWRYSQPMAVYSP